MSWRGIGTKLAEYYKELVATNVRFEELRRQSTETMGEFKLVVLRLQEQAQTRELRHVQDIADLKAQIGSLQERLNILSEKALHAAIREVAREKLAQAPADGVEKQLPRRKDR